MPEGQELPEEIAAEQKERLEYVKNIGIEYEYGCYEEKRSDSCHLLGEYREAVEQKFDSAYKLFKENCEDKIYPKSCFKYAKYIQTGKWCTPSFAKMITPLKVACDAKLVPACHLLGKIYLIRPLV